MYTRAYFENIRNHIIKEIESAQISIMVAVAWFTDVELLRALSRKAASGIEVVLIIMDDDVNNKMGLDYTYLSRYGGKVWKVKDYASSSALMHNKFCIIDNITTITGSYNWTKQAQKNQESILITRFDENLAQQFIDYFLKLKEKYFLDDNNMLKHQDFSSEESKQEGFLGDDMYIDPRDGKGYKTVKIGHQIWMAENLKYNPNEKYSKPWLNRGIWIHEGWENESLISTTESSVYYKKYGCLYNWKTAIKVSPPGWHLPSKEEWEELIEYLGGKESATGKLKSRNEWQSETPWPTDNYGFSALPGGYFTPDGKDPKMCIDGERPHFRSGKNHGGYWWTSTMYNKTTQSYSIRFSNYGIGTEILLLGGNSRKLGFSIRCIRD